MKKFSFLLVTALSLLMPSCIKEVKYKTAASGLKYTFTSEHNGPKPHEGDYLTLNMIYKFENDSVLFDSRDARMPMRYQLRKPPFAGAVEEGIMLMSPGDTALFLVSADSMFAKVFHRPMPPEIKKGSKVIFEIHLFKIQGAADAEAEIRKTLEDRFIAEKQSLDKYIEENRIKEKPTVNGLYIIVTEKKKGKLPVKGNKITVQYTGKFLNGEVFDALLPNHPMIYTLGEGKMLAGWEEAFAQLHEGEKAVLIIPSELAYGEKGKRNAASGVYIVPPYTTLVYEVEVLSIKE
jgi:FKBP-type peptidyl-prolyl cis-trans isomerase FkpA